MVLYIPYYCLALSAKMSGTMVQNPLYEAADDHYDHLPDCNGHPLPSLTNHHPPIAITPSSNPSQVDITPQLPPPRKEPGSNGATLGVGNHSHQCLSNVNLPESLLALVSVTVWCVCIFGRGLLHDHESRLASQPTCLASQPTHKMAREYSRPMETSVLIVKA